MKIIISPAKSLGKLQLESNIPTSECIFLNEAEILAKKLKKNSVKKLEKMMHVSNDIATLNFERFQAWEKPLVENISVQPAIAQFTGEVYRGLHAETLSNKQMEFAQNNLRILSGMYGILRPMDLMFPYRLEMGTSWAITPKVKTLYQFWGIKLAKQLNTEMEKGEDLINLASAEYFKAIDKKTIKSKIITPHFKEMKNGELKTIAIFAKNARGKMARFIIENQLSKMDELMGFDMDGYRFQAAISTDTEWIFTR